VTDNIEIQETQSGLRERQRRTGWSLGPWTLTKR